jgi:hypothetical protein
MVNRGTHDTLRKHLAKLGLTFCLTAVPIFVRILQEPPLDCDVEEFAMDAYTAAAAAAAAAATSAAAPGARVRMADVVAHCCAHAEARCWLYYFADPAEPDSTTADSTVTAVDTTIAAATAAAAASTPQAELQWQQQLLGLDALPAQCSWRERMAQQGESLFVTPLPPLTQEPAWIDTVRSLVPKDEARGKANSSSSSSSGSSSTVYAELQWVSDTLVTHSCSIPFASAISL